MYRDQLILYAGVISILGTLAILTILSGMETAPISDPINHDIEKAKAKIEYANTHFKMAFLIMYNNGIHEIDNFTSKEAYFYFIDDIENGIDYRVMLVLPLVNFTFYTNDLNFITTSCFIFLDNGIYPTKDQLIYDHFQISNQSYITIRIGL